MIEYPKYKKVLFCTDFSENADYALDYAFGIAKRDGGILYILFVSPLAMQEEIIKPYMNETNLKEIHEKEQREIEQLINDRYLSQIEDKSKLRVVIKSGCADEEIIKFAKQKKIDIIILGKHGKSKLEHHLFGSVAERVIRSSAIPVFIIPRKIQPSNT